MNGAVEMFEIRASLYLNHFRACLVGQNAKNELNPIRDCCKQVCKSKHTTGYDNNKTVMKQEIFIRDQQQKHVNDHWHGLKMGLVN